ncbi:MAG: HD-GYP domain-containing protein, partial [Alphaproteobacteria bacterium]
YLMNEEETELSFAIIRNDSLNIALGGTTGADIPFPPLSLYRGDDSPNYANVATAVALTKTTVNVADAYTAEAFDFSGTKAFDARTGYRSMSFLTVPLLNHQDEVIGVLQLINARDDAGRVIPFASEVQPLIEALASQAAVAIENHTLAEQQKVLLESLIHLIAGAIDAKSPYTGGHCQRVPAITEMLARAAHESTTGPFAEFHLDENDWYTLHLAAWLHDCGKVTTPEYVVDKAVKLETIYNRIHEVRQRFEILRRDAEIEMLRAQMAGAGREAEARFHARVRELEEQFAFVAECNVGGEFLDKAKVERLHELGSQTFVRYFDRSVGLSWEEGKRLPPFTPTPAREPLLSDRPDHDVGEYNRGELYNLSVSRGTLTEEERQKINDHIRVTIDMLEQLPFPKHLRNIVEYAGGHHEKMDGTGYPRGLLREEMSIPARIMAIADIFEALTASDRPYKKAKKLSEAIRIMSFMKKDAHVDPELFDLFLESRVWKSYAEKFLDPEQIDEVDIASYLSRAAAE